MIDCLPAEEPPYYCTVCGWGKKYNFTEPFRRNCPAVPENIEERKQRFLDSLNPNPVDPNARTLKEIKAILDEHCTPCEHFTGDNCRDYKGCDGQKVWKIFLLDRNRTCKRIDWPSK